MLDAATCTTASLADLAREVKVAAARVGTAPGQRFGARKVFISALRTELGFHVATDDLVEMNRAGLLELARADLVAAMPAMAVAASRIQSLGAEFHFVIDDQAREPWAAA